MARTNEEQLELFADLLEPAAEIISDKEVAEILRGKGKPVTAVKLAIKNHKSAVISLLAALDGTDADSYKVPSPAVLTMKLLTFLNSDELKDLFISQPQKTDAGSSGAATESTEDGAN